ncbi:MAG: DUF6164 family protein [Methylomonas sp.]
MSILFFSLRGVPEDEADDVRELLSANDIDFYETSAGNWGISMPAIWLYRADDLEKVRPLFDRYQEQRAISQRALYEELKRQGKVPGFLRHNLRKPLRFAIFSGAIALTVFASLKWLFDLGF